MLSQDSTLTHNGYKASITIDWDAGVINGKILDINDVLTFSGRNVEDAKRQFIRTIDSYLEFCQQEGIEPEKPFSGRLPFRTKPDVHRLIHRAAQKVGKSINAWMEEKLWEAAQADLNEAPPPASGAPPPPVQQILERRNGPAELVAAATPFLDRRKLRDINQLVDVLETFLIGIGTIQPYLNPDEPEALSEIASRLNNLLPIELSTSPSSDDPALIPNPDPMPQSPRKK